MEKDRFKVKVRRPKNEQKNFKESIEHRNKHFKDQLIGQDYSQNIAASSNAVTGKCLNL